MSDYLDLAVSLHTKSLTLFIGTGFSKYLTDGAAPSWSELIHECTQRIDKNNKLTQQLFLLDENGAYTISKYELTVCAQILEHEYTQNNRNIKEEIVDIINQRINSATINQKKLTHLQEFFQKYPEVNIVTTNYDTLFSEYIMPFTSRIIIEGNVIPRINSGQNIFHIHGCINNPKSIVLTLNDYYKFQNSNNYFSRKFFTLLQETTVAVLGYSLGDFNLNTILNEVKDTKKHSFKKTDIYYVSKDVVPDVISKFYTMTYGIKTIENKQMELFFNSIDNNIDRAKLLIDSVQNLKDVMNGDKIFADDFLRYGGAINDICFMATGIGVERDNKQFLNMLINILNKKKEFTQVIGAWDQYHHFADWLIEVSSILVIKGTIIEKDFCDLVRFSFNTSSKRAIPGYSWQSWQEWFTRWDDMKVENQAMLKNLINNETWDSFNEIPDLCN